MTTAMTAGEKKQALEAAEAELDASYANFKKHFVAKARDVVAKIEEGELWRAGPYTSMVDYIEKRWDYSKSHSYALVAEAGMRSKLTKSQNEVITASHIKHLQKVPDDKLADVVDKITAQPNINEGVVKKIVTTAVPPPPRKRVAAAEQLDRQNAMAIQQAINLINELPIDGATAFDRYGDKLKKPQQFVDWVNEFKAQMDPVLTVPLQDGSPYAIGAEDIERWKATYKRIDVDDELSRLVAWNHANPMKRKTRKGIRSHINQWLSRKDQEVAPPAPSNGTARRDTRPQNRI